MPEVYKKPAGSGWPLQGVLLYLLPLPLVAVALSAFSGGDSARLIAALMALGLLWSGAALNRSGLKAEAEFRRRRIAVAPRTPRKTMAAIMVALGAGWSAFALAQIGVVSSAVAAVLALIGTVLAYGADPRGTKGAAASVAGYSTEEIVAALSEAEAKVDAIVDAARQITVAEFSQRLRDIAESARKVIKVIEDDPRDLRRARKFLHVYLDGARDVAHRYAAAPEEARNASLDDNFRDMLGTIESSFDETRARLLENDTLDLDVQIEVLTTRLKKEGVI
ncbi:MAG: 5-bromo-4-chloroindolyl phosphate hydrolysis family protein [Pseudomonadota bacterium]